MADTPLQEVLGYPIASAQSEKDKDYYQRVQDNYTRSRKKFREALRAIGSNNSERRILPQNTKIDLNALLSDTQKAAKKIIGETNLNFALSGTKMQQLLGQIQKKLADSKIDIDTLEKDRMRPATPEDRQKVKDSLDEFKEELKGKIGKKYGQTIGPNVNIDDVLDDAVTVSLDNKAHFGAIGDFAAKIQDATEDIETMWQLKRLLEQYIEQIKIFREQAAKLLELGKKDSPIKNTTQLQNFITATDNQLNIDKVLRLLLGGKVGNEKFGNAWGLIMEDVVGVTLNAYLQSVKQENLEATVAEELKGIIKGMKTKGAYTMTGNAIKGTIRGLTESRLAQPLRDVVITYTLNDGVTKTVGVSIKNYNFANQGKSKRHKTLESTFVGENGNGLGALEVSQISPEIMRTYFLRVLAATRNETKNDDDVSVPNYIGQKYAHQIWLGSNMEKGTALQEDYSELMVVNGILMNTADYLSGINPVASFTYNSAEKDSPAQWLAKEDFEKFIKRVTSGKFIFHSEWDMSASFHQDLWDRISLGRTNK